MSGHATAQRSHCQNCGEALAGPYCSACGQHDVDYHRSIGPVVEDALEGFLHFDGKFFRSVRYLFTRPGYLTKEFIAGRRMSYMHPLRFYIFASFLFFATGFLTDHRPTAAEKAALKAKSEETARKATEEAGKLKADLELDGDAAKGADASPGANGVTLSAEPSSRWGWLNRKLRMAYSSDGHLDKKALSAEIKHLLPTMLFLCLPFFAAVLKAVYLRSRRLYIEHLIFALHVMTFVFLASLFAELAQRLGALVGDGTEQFVGLGTFLAGAWLIYRAFRVVYGQGRWKTLFKMALITGVYSLVLVVAVCGLALASFYIVKQDA
jgi:hypothetical protein